jgi:prepilin-type N-terminal cleavage/methylation domain-containing protein
MRKQAGFTLVEIAIVLVIIGLLLGGVLKGQELINSAKVKNFATDFRNIPLLIYGYQDKFKALPGDDAAASTHVNGAANASTPATCGGGSAVCTGTGRLDGNWLPANKTDETLLFWQHVRLAGLAAGPTDTATGTINEFLPKNAEGQIIGIESGSAHYIKDAGAATTFMPGTYTVCSQGILGKFAKQLDITMDDGNTQAGSMRVVGMSHTRGNEAIGTAAVDDATTYIVCMGI